MVDVIVHSTCICPAGVDGQSRRRSQHLRKSVRTEISRPGFAALTDQLGRQVWSFGRWFRYWILGIGYQDYPGQRNRFDKKKHKCLKHGNETIIAATTGRWTKAVTSNQQPELDLASNTLPWSLGENQHNGSNPTDWRTLVRLPRLPLRCKRLHGVEQEPKAGRSFRVLMLWMRH